MVEEDIRKLSEWLGCEVVELNVQIDHVHVVPPPLAVVIDKGTRAGSSRSTRRNCRSLQKRLSGRERRAATLINHTISKSIVAKAKAQGKGIAIEELTHIRSTSKRRRNKGFRRKLSRWSSRQLRQFIEYKAALAGVKVIARNPAYSSLTCSDRHHIGERRGQVFRCRYCGLEIDADLNGSINLGTPVAARNQPEKSILYSCAVHYQV